MTPKEKIQKLIENKQGGGKDIQRSTAKNDQKFIRKAPNIFKKAVASKIWGRIGYVGNNLVVLKILIAVAVNNLFTYTYSL